MSRRRVRLYYLVYLAYLGIYWDTVFSGAGKSLGGSFLLLYVAGYMYNWNGSLWDYAILVLI